MEAPAAPSPAFRVLTTDELGFVKGNDAPVHFRRGCWCVWRLTLMMLFGIVLEAAGAPQLTNLRCVDRWYVPILLANPQEGVSQLH